MGKFNKIVATGLIALMIANFASCDTSQINENEFGKESLNSTQNIHQGLTNQNNSSGETKFKGSIWNELSTTWKGAMLGFSTSEAKELLDWQPIPSQFLMEEGLIYKSQYGPLAINNPDNDQNVEVGFQTMAYIDPDSPENDIYLITNFRNKMPVQNATNEDVYFATWQLKYTLDDANYQTFLNMQGDSRIRLFIQEMDRQFEPQVISKTVYNHNLLRCGSYMRDKGLEYNIFPYIFIAGIDYDNDALKFGSLTKTGIKYINVDMQETAVWDEMLNKYNWSEDEAMRQISMETNDTIAGNCLISFHLGGRDGRCMMLSNDEAKERFKTTTDILKLTPVDVNVEGFKYDFTKGFNQ